MKKTTYVNMLSAAVTFSLLTMMSCTENQNANSEKSTEAEAVAVAILEGTTPETALDGKASFSQEGKNVKMHLELTIPSKANQSVAVHFHAMGDCGDMGKMAGGHWNPTNEDHGKWGGASFHSGDIGNISLDASGKGSIDMDTDRWSLSGDSTTNIMNKSIIVHAGTDDYTTQPSGNSGDRIGCGMIKKS